jgi:Bacterial regulatory helix-turn-helix protein, lysR family
LKSGVGRIERHQLQHHPVRPAKAVLGWILSAPTQLVSCDQPALSRQIQDLEEELGFKLFERLPRRVKLSAADELFLQDARRILQEVSEAVVRAARVARGQSGTLRVDSQRMHPGAALFRTPSADSESSGPTQYGSFNRRRA